MTVRRESAEYFDADSSAIAAAVRAVLDRPPYRGTVEPEKELVFKTNVRPYWWLLGTDLTIRLEPSSLGTRVIAETESQWFVMGDVFESYNGYIREFLRNLRTEVETVKLRTEVQSA